MSIIMLLFSKIEWAMQKRDYFLKFIKDFKFSTILYILIIDWFLWLIINLLYIRE